ncbi:hypothetical protein FOXB_04035 [Fusarium oxysporum f. sp. conglutinans Fo5176]|uniref:nitrilase n=1 Tax=Fusarium oxysporum (strain Fo5176) TaxID=660025 RepID=F9FCA7_FUSOF|nr:hypothetical protein FOXB_04035 [Fusarium oxysporum f. sp. conglutinans Fo5176]
MSGRTHKVAVTQAEPVWLDLAGSISKTCGLINEAAENGARLFAFPECWVPGYPGWIWLAQSRTLWQFPSGFQSAPIHIAFTPLQVITTPQGEIAAHHRKPKPTHMERTIFGDGSGNDLNIIAAIDFGDIGVVKVGNLACWEHAQPLLKYHAYSQHEDIHINAWPPIDPHGGTDAPGLWSMSAEGLQCMSQMYAIEGGAYVPHCTAVCNQSGVDRTKTKGSLLFQEPGGGDSAVYGPDGRRLTKPLASGDVAAEGIIYTELDLKAIVTNRSLLDVLRVDTKQKHLVVSTKDKHEHA